MHARKRNALPSHIALMHDTEEEKEKEKDEKIGQNLQKETRHGSRDGEGEGSFSNQSKNPNFRKRLLRILNKESRKIYCCRAEKESSWNGGFKNRRKGFNQQFRRHSTCSRTIRRGSLFESGKVFVAGFPSFHLVPRVI